MRTWLCFPAALSLLYYVVGGVCYSFGAQGLWVFLFAGLWFLALGVLPSPFFWPLFGITLGAVAFFLFLFWQALKKSAPEKPVEAILVLGARADGSVPRRILQKRAEKAAGLIRQNPDAVCLIAGGCAGGGKAECRLLYEELKKHGAAPKAWIPEERSLTTKENFLFAFPLFPEGITLAAVVTSDCHVFRARKTALSTRPPCALTFYGAKTPPLYRPAFIARETITFTVDALRGNLDPFSSPKHHRR